MAGEFLKGRSFVRGENKSKRQTFAREDVSHLGIRRPKTPDDTSSIYEVVPDLTELAVEETASQAQNALEMEETNDELSEFYQIVKHILDGKLPEYFEMEAYEALSMQMRKMLPAYRNEKRQEFIDKHDQIVPIHEFEKIFSDLQRRIGNLFVFQRFMAEIKYFFETVDADHRSEFVRSDNFEKKFIPNFAYTLNHYCYNQEGFKELTGSHQYMDTLFRNGKFDTFGVDLLSTTLLEIDKVIEGFSRSMFTGAGDDFLQMITEARALIVSLKENDWNFEGEDLDFLRKIYKYKKYPPESNFPQIAESIEKAIRIHSKPSAISEGLLSPGDIEQINLAKNIIRNAFGAGGIIAKSDIHLLESIAKYIQDVIRLKKGLLSEKEIQTLKQIVCEIEVVCTKEYRFSPEVGEDELEIFLDTCSKKSDEALAKAKKEIRQYRKSKFESAKNPTNILEPYMLSKMVEEKNGVLVEEKLRTSGAFVQTINYCVKSPNFNKVLSEALEFENLLQELQSAEDTENFEELVELLQKLNLPSPSNLGGFLENDIERHLYIIFAKKYFEAKQKGKQEYFEKNIPFYIQDFASKKSSLIKKILHLSTLKHGVLEAFTNFSDRKTSGRKTYEVYLEMKKSSSKHLKGQGQSPFENFVIDANDFYTLKTLIGIGEKVFDLSLSEIDPLSETDKTLLDDSEKFLSNIIDFSSPKYFKAEYLLEPQDIERLRKVADFCYEIKDLHPSFNSLYSRRIVKSAINKFLRR